MPKPTDQAAPKPKLTHSRTYPESQGPPSYDPREAYGTHAAPKHYPPWTAETHGSTTYPVDPHGHSAGSISAKAPAHQAWADHCLHPEHSQPWHHHSIISPSPSTSSSHDTNNRQHTILEQLKQVDATMQTHLYQGDLQRNPEEHEAPPPSADMNARDDDSDLHGVGAWADAEAPFTNEGEEDWSGKHFEPE
ncbi:MAG: hypothetical protein Q9160_008843 [Pyrenula sp. 1 TL-2023]